MPGHTDVYLITGFLGAGKTTFLNRIIHRFPKDKKMTLLVNEFGEVGVDGTLVEGDDIDMMEISKGSIFCVCVKTDFIKGLYELNNTIQPDVLLIESTGVANPSDLKRDLQLPIFNDRFFFKEQFCVIDAAHFLDAFEVYASLEKQIASSTAFIINKVDLAGADVVKEVKAVVGRFHPDPQFFETTYADIPLERFFEVSREPAAAEAAAEDAPQAVLSEAELDRFLEELLDSPDLEITPPDTLVSTAYRWKGTNLDRIREAAERLPRAVVRAKGFVEGENGLYIFNYVMGTWTLEPTTRPPEKIQYKNVVVFIGPPESMDEIAEATGSGEWTSQGIFQPYGGEQG
ncbi:MAG: GTP-binding protein [Desulfobacteraceae bacterium]|nr:GTP-binding protein [Desulfobacteraceae bacterium]